MKKKSNLPKTSFATRAIHAGQSADPTTGAIMTPIYASSTYVQDSPGVHKGYEYSRTANPTRSAYEQCIANLEGGSSAFAFASGMAAADAVLSLLEPGDEILAIDDLYGGTRRLFENIRKSTSGLNFVYGDLSKNQVINNLVSEKTKMIWIETPTNPMLKLVDLSFISKIAKEKNVVTVVDNTFCSPYIQRPIEFGVDIVIHAAALKQVPATEADPFEAVQTNIIGTKNVIESSIDAGVNRVICLSTDKAVNPINLYGATKLVAEKLTVQANAYSNNKRPIFACCRYGNVVGSRGSVVPIFKEQKFSGKLTVTDKRMTRFWITLEKGVRFVIHCLENMNGGELFIPKIPSTKITDIAEAIAPEAHISTIGIRPGEKLHETLISKDETRQVMEYDDFFVIEPSYHTWGFESHKNGKPISENFTYTSENSLFKLGVNEIKDLLDSDEDK